MADNNGAIFDSSRQYRYTIWRQWDGNKPRVTFIMLNPSTADELVDDPTLRRCIGFAKSWGYGSVELVNLFAFRATDPKELKEALDPVGAENNQYILGAVHRSALVILAWGEKGRLNERDCEVISLISGMCEMHCLGIGKNGCPRHPLFMKSDTEPIRFDK